MVNIVIYLYIIILKDNISPLIKYCGFYNPILTSVLQVSWHTYSLVMCANCSSSQFINCLLIHLFFIYILLCFTLFFIFQSFFSIWINLKSLLAQEVFYFVLTIYILQVWHILYIKNVCNLCNSCNL